MRKVEKYPKNAEINYFYLKLTIFNLDQVFFGNIIVP